MSKSSSKKYYLDNDELKSEILKCKESKIARAEAISTYVESGNVYIPEQASYMNELEFEIVNFPAVEHDDQIDSMTQALNYFREKAPLKISENNLKILRYGKYHHG